MAKQSKKLISRERTNTIGYENDGQEAFRFGFESRDYEEGDAMTTEKDAENLVCVDHARDKAGHRDHKADDQQQRGSHKEPGPQPGQHSAQAFGEDPPPPGQRLSDPS